MLQATIRDLTEGLEELQAPCSRPTGAVMAAAEAEALALHIPSLENADWETMVDAWIEIHKAIQSHLWAMAKIAAQVEVKWGENSFGAFASEVGYSARRVYQFAETYKRWEYLQTSQILSFSHHAVAAQSIDPERAIIAAEDNQLSTRELETHIETKIGKVDRRTGEIKPLRSGRYECCTNCGGKGRVFIEED